MFDIIEILMRQPSKLAKVVTAIDESVSTSMLYGDYSYIQTTVPKVVEKLEEKDYSMLLRVLMYKTKRDKTPAATPFYEEAIKCSIASRLDNL
jgi:hypothetical protein